jgi:hypothetical protein
MREMPGFAADDLLGWIAAVGALRLLSEVTGGAARLSWRRHGGGWRLVALDVGEPAVVAGRAHAWLSHAASAWDWGGFDDVSFAPGAWTTAAQTSEGLAAELWVALGSDGCVRRDGRLEASRLEYAQGGGHQHWLASLRGAVRRVAEGAVTAADLGRVLWGGWRREDLGLVCRWDWRCERDHALMAADPTSREMLMRQDHAATVLAAVGLASLPTAPTGRGLVGALAGQDDGETVCWPIWEVPLGIADVEALVCSAALLRFAGASSARELAARGIGAVMTARRWYAGKLIVFGRGRELART